MKNRNAEAQQHARTVVDRLQSHSLPNGDADRIANELIYLAYRIECLGVLRPEKG